jgi:hypothetical protein
VHLAAALISNSTAAMEAENRVRESQGQAPAFTAQSFWTELESIYDQLDLPHDGGVILPWKLMER